MVRNFKAILIAEHGERAADIFSEEKGSTPYEDRMAVYFVQHALLGDHQVP